MTNRGKKGLTKALIGDLYDLHYEEMYLVARRYLTGEESRDIVQDVFLRLVERIGDTEIRTSLRAYLYRSVIHSCLNFLKQKKVREEYALDFRMRLLEEEARRAGSAGEDLLPAKEIRAVVMRTVATLPEKNRQIFEMSRFEGLSHKEIARNLGISVRTVETQIYRALKVLHRALEEFTSR
jgi:RNA polymerase sigma-70 factor (ECF subfamily)